MEKRGRMATEYLDNLFYEKEILGFLDRFLRPDDLSDAFALPNAPTSREQVLHDITEIWEQEGRFLHPAELTSQLIHKYLPHISEGNLALITEKMAEQYAEKDKMTGFMRKPTAGIFTGLAHLYERAMRGAHDYTPVSILEGDFSNMGGTNLHFKKMIAEHFGLLETEVEDSRAEQLTDRVAWIISQLAVEEASKGRNDADIHAIRTGGDEIRIIVSGLEPLEHREVERHIHERIEELMRDLTLCNHPHLKDGKGPLDAGFGAAVSFVSQDFVKAPLAAIAEADQKMAHTKKSLGFGRQEAREDPALSYEDFVSRLEAAEQALNKDASMRTSTELGVFEDIGRQENEFEVFPTTEDLRRMGFAYFVEENGLKDDLGGTVGSNYIKGDVSYNYLSDICVNAPRDPVAGADIRTERDVPANIGLLVKDSQGYLGDETPIFAYGIAFQNLAGLNKTLGHANADLFLQYLAQDVLKGSMQSSGGIAPDDVVISHQGGGNFIATVKPWRIFDDPDFFDKFYAEFDVKLRQRVAELNEMTLTGAGDNDFARQIGLDLDGLEDVPNKVHEIPDAKGRKGLDGIHVATVMHKLEYKQEGEPLISGGRQMYNLETALETEVMNYRDAISMAYLDAELDDCYADKQPNAAKPSCSHR